MLRLPDIAQIVTARRLLRELEKRSVEGADDEYPTGKFNEACHAADVALRNILIIGRHELGSSAVSDEHIHME